MILRSCLAVIILLACHPRTIQANIWDAKADIVFVLDGSDTVGPDEWDAMRSMLLSLVQQWTIGPNNMQVGVVSYGDGAHNEFFFNDASNASQLEDQLNAMNFSGGTADAAEAIRFAYRTSFSSLHGTRDDVPHIVVHITDGPSASPSLLLQESENAKNQGVTIFNIGVGAGVMRDELAKVASDPNSRYVFQADTFTALSNLVPTLSARINGEIPVSASALPQPSSCLTKADLVLLIDSSSSVGQEDFGNLEDFIKDLILQLPVGQDQVQVGVVQFSGHPRLEFPLNMYSDRLSVLKAVENLQFMGGGTNTGDALKYITNSVFTADAGARTDVPRVTIVITDGQSIDSAKTLEAAEAARLNSIALIAIGVGSTVNGEELKNIANDPDSDNVMNVTNYKNLLNVSSSILDASCNLNSMITTLPTLAPGVSTTPQQCVDKLDNCEDYNERSCTDYEAWARENCRKRCGFCKTAEEITCQDKVEHCDTYGLDVCSSRQYGQWAYENCKRFCGFCDSGAPKLGFYGKCMYKGLEYIQSERWEDGCDYECVCENANEGLYRCYNRCPVYHDLPAQCTLVGVPNECCLQPVCNFDQKLTISNVEEGVSYNAQNIPVCEYQGKQYFEGQTWEVGCDLKCVCTNSTLGAYQCQSYCPDYPDLPDDCRMVQKPGQCCSEPVCEFDTQTGSFTGFGTLSGRGIGMTVQSASCQDEVVDCEEYGRAVCTEYASWARVNCAKFCNLCTPDSRVPGPDDTCYYNGERHSEGETWQIGCDTECVCEDAIYGYYRCYSSCPTYLNLPNGCRTVQEDDACCQSVECEYGTYYPSSTNIFSLGNGGGLRVKESGGQLIEVKPTLPSGSTLPPGTLGGSTGLSNIRLDGCLFNGRMYIQSQQWHDGCNHTCSCQDASTGHFSCRERCPKYSNVSDACDLKPDPNDPCCMMPNCPPSMNFVPIPIYGKGLQSIGAVVTPNLPDLVSGMFTARFTLIYSAFTVPPPTAPSNSLKPGGLDYCEYKGQRYSQAESWEDGCSYNCVCEDASTGSWRCVDKCEKYVALPEPCHLEQDPMNPCCQRPVCNFVIGHNQIEGNNTLPTTTSTTTATTPTTTAGYWEPKCVYKGVEYAVGQSWFDGCDLKCKCDDADQNIFTCLSRCPAYPTDYDGCPARPDPEDPSCCVVPVCTPTAAPYFTPYPGATPPPTQAPPRIPVIPPGVVSGGNTTGYCIYNGVHYSQDDTWEDGCDYTCVCEDAATGVYKCTEKCQRYGALPSACHLVTDYTNPCCKMPTCIGYIDTFTGTALPPGESTPAPSAVCVYNNVRFQQGQVWQEGCSQVCRCEDADNGLYSCSDRCPRYDALPPECTLVSDTEDPCCLKPKCVPSVLSGTTLAPVPYLIPTLEPGRIVGTVTYPTPTAGSGVTPGINFCIYNGVPYGKGETWRDGCQYNCVCEDPATGRYECTERCTRYLAIPAGCVLMKDAADPCCERPVCSPDLVETQTPLPGTTATPPFGSTVTPPVDVSTSGPTPLPKDVCVYKNELYTQGQTWYDGCDYSCTCEEANTGVYRCTERCPTYENLPAECSLRPDPADPLCCQRPFCQFVPTVNQTQGYLIPPLRPGVVTGGSVTPTPLPYNTPTPGPDGSTLEPPRSTPKPKNVCYYNGQEYAQGQKWADGCDYNCECLDAVSGRYQCIEKCMRWSSIPAQCTLVTDPSNPCCEVPYCDTKKPTPTPLSTVSPLPGTTREPFIRPDGSTLAPPTVQTAAPPKNRCLYNGVPYRTGESWEDGCDLKCVCEDGESNVYRCDQRCSVYKLTSDCVLVTDPADSCCQVPFCSPVAPSTEAPTPGTPVTGPDGSTLFPPTPGPTRGPNVSPNRPPYLVPTGIPGTQIGIVNKPNLTPGSNESVGCLYNGVTYQKGESWDDGCARKCVCLNSTAGVYECNERCTRYLNVPSSCQLVPDPLDSCCKTPLCLPTTQTPTATPTAGPDVTPVSGQTTASVGTGSPTPSISVYITQSPKKMCSYKGQYYLEGQQWYDGCDKVCVCENGDANIYTCSDRCATYSNIPPQCQLVASPDDPSCCQVPQCVPTPGPNGYPTAGPDATPTATVFTNPPGVVTGVAITPSPLPGQTITGYRNACAYKGRIYQEGQQWQDSCDYNCECVNGTTGYYQCIERCPTYPFVPSQCMMIPDPMDYCCKKLECDFRKPTPNPFSPTMAPTRVPDPNLHTTVTPTLGDVTTNVAPTGMPTPTYVAPTIAPQYTFCVYNGITYRQGDKWNIGCDQVCTCDDSTNNYYTCVDRCPVYVNLPSNCQMMVDADDACCQVPSCYVMPTLGPGVTPQVVPGQTTPAPLPYPTNVPGIIIGTPNKNPSRNETGCVKNNVRYIPGDTWQEGCQYNCECLDTTGRYRCTERCIRYPSIPDYCVTVPDPNDSCCMVPWCLNPLATPSPMSTVTPVPQSPGVSTLQPTPGNSPMPTTPIIPLPKDVCVYNGNAYTEGQLWYDACDKVCLCEDGKTGFYRCSDRCGTYKDLPANCKLVPDLQDPTCCVVPQCEQPDNLNITGHVGVVTGYGKPPTPTPPQSTLTPPLGSTLQPPVGVFLTPQPETDVCVYNGRTYSQGQTWLDGCDYNCECVNATLGQYRCTDRCPRYPQSIATFCTMVRNATDPCCMSPDCSATPTPQPGSTVTPPRANTPFPTLHPTLVPGREFCVYKGIPYSHGQTWNDGCDKTCRCEDVVTGQINCDDRCPSYTSTPAGCQLVTDPKDFCCRVPDCPPQPGQNNTVIIRGPTGVISGNSLPPNHRGPLTRRDECIYHGRTYKQGEVWDDGCAYTCECIDSTQGKYLCKERCERIVQMPPTCTMIEDPDDKCCQTPYCLPWPPRAPTAAPGAIPTAGTLSPNATPTAAPAVTPAPVACVYKGQAYRQDQLWYDGCDVACRCEDAAVGFYRCQERCARYEPGPGCVMVPDPQDPVCCEIPQCPLATPTPLPGVTPTPGIVDVVTLVPGKIVGIGKVPTPMPTLIPTPGPDGSTLTPVPLTGCYYKGVTYQATQTWEDGCDYVCECINGTTGRYSCSEKCPILPQFPQDRCVLVQDPQEPCCMKPYCDYVNPTPFPNGTPTPYPIVVPTGQSTLVPGNVPTATPTPGPIGIPTGFCVYNGAYYRQGEQWADGCDVECVCDNATTGYYTCKERCKSFGKLADDCVLKADPSDSCCLVPECRQPPVIITPQPLPGVTGTATPSPYYILTGVQKGSFTGTGNIGRPTGSYGSNTGYSNGCIYKQTLYQQGALWDDGCDYVCTCVDALRGIYQCTDRCLPLYFLPPTCGLEPDPNDACCKQARCTPVLSTAAPTATTPVVISGQTGTGLAGTGSTANPESTYSSFTGTGPVVTITPENPTGITGTKSTPGSPGSTFTDHTGTGPIINVTPNVGTGVTGTGPTGNPQSTLTSFTGAGTVITITPENPTGFGGTKTTPGSPGSTFTDHTGTGPIINITPNTATGLSGTGSTMNFGSSVSSFTGTRGACVYKGVMYHTGDSWDDGCDLRCTCDDEVTGFYTCTYRCPAYSGLPQFCHLQPDPNDACCKKPVCTVQGTQLVPQIGGTPTRSPTLEPSVTNVIPLGTHTIISGSSRPPGQGVQTIYGGRSSCVYKGVEYIPGESWDDGCVYTCTCIGEDVGLYRCVSKCPSYPALPQYCTLTDIPGVCCPSLNCDIPNVGGYNPYPQVEPMAKPTAGPDGLFPTPQPTVDPQLILGPGLGIVTGGTGQPGGGAQVPGGFLHNLGGITDKCIYDLRMYNQGEMWDIGCNYTCRCLDSRTGYYQCKERCASYDLTRLPQTCKLIEDPADSCCQTPSCPNKQGQPITNITQIQQMYPIVGSYVGGTSGFRPGYVPTGIYGTVEGSRNGCIYKGQRYATGATWEDGCEYDCQCIDGSTGLYQCTAKCVSYSALPPVCKLVDVAGQCCKEVNCDPITTAAPCRDKIDNCYQYRKSSCSGAYEAWAHEHCPLFCEFCTPDVTTAPAPCEDAVPNCENYNDDICTNVAYADWAQSNCRKFCNLCGSTTKATTIWTTPTSGCYDAISYCEEYGKDVCTDPNYKRWVIDNCQLYCGICQGEMTVSTTPEQCVDKIGTDTCKLYGRGSCGGQYFGFARQNCRKFCDLCNVTTQAPGSATTGTTPPPCADKLDNCNAYPQVYCEGDYLAWAADNCPAHCGLCNYDVTQATVRVVTEPGWLVLMKGVTGVPGDLWQLWSTTNTQNPNVPQAQYLTNQYRGHYKPEIANQWDGCNFQTVKVAIFNNGEEKANIVFDVRNSGKNDWFKPENVISSTFNDLPTTPGSFGMAKDSGTGHEFAIGDFTDCQGSGWFLVSTSQDCTYQKTGEAPQFYYSLTDTVAQLSPGQLGAGDVFAILGQGGNCMSGFLPTRGTITGNLSGCFYKNVTYAEGDVWQDGCDYNCTCQDGSHGQYYCVDQCLTYNNLPEECTLEKDPGECCAELKCPYPTGEGCYYKNQTYPQGATWQDGCLYDCTCNDGETGGYSCVGICQDWSSLPAECHMEDPDPGKCCPRPVCPAPIVVDFTPR